MVELKSNDQAKKLGAIATFLDILVTVSPHKSLNSSKGVIRSRDLRCCSEEEMVEELSGVTHARRIKGGHVERDCSADPHCVNCRGDHAANSKTCPKFLEEQAILRCKAENGGTFQQARKSVVVEIHKTIPTRTFASAVKSQLRTKPAALPKDGGRSAPSAPPKGKKAQKDSPAPSPQGAAEIEVPAQHRAEKSKRQEDPRETVNRFAPLVMDAEDTISSIWGEFLHPQLPEGLRLPYGVPSPSKSRPPPPAEKPQGPPPSPSPPYPFTPVVQVTEGVKATKKLKGLEGQPKGGLPSNKMSVLMDTVVQSNIRGFRSNFEELKLLLNRSQSAVVALQDCRLGEGQVSPRGYTLLLPQGGSPGGEAALLIRNGTRFSEIDLKTGLHAAAATISLEKTLTVCSLYLPPDSPVSKLSLAELFE
ncbi:nucleic-acid-binding protein from mobile element jockey [Plakobranchus ocellatus]|uniref:Nucleic-acid-binding protein from mobile element jockey n=1 Tax=Plakobranchus ocellatus TaxID=259542 RepID=A0AAV4CJR6_9GAST|nr:nucleic-acid-binding protein from mobile element jockey [Plakobranchus ocellatus]